MTIIYRGTPEGRAGSHFPLNHRSYSSPLVIHPHSPQTNKQVSTMSSADDKNFVDSAAVPETNINAEKEDRLAEESEATGKVSKGE